MNPATGFQLIILAPCFWVQIGVYLPEPSGSRLIVLGIIIMILTHLI